MIELVEALAIFTAFNAVVSFPVQLKDVIEVHGVMPPIVAVPFESVTVPQTTRGEVCGVLEQVDVEPQVLTFWATEVSERPELVRLPSDANFGNVPVVPVPSLI